MARIAMPVGAGFEDSELTVPLERLREAGHEVLVMGTKKGERLEGKRGQATAVVEATAAEAAPEAFDALVLPGGFGPDRLRTDAEMVDFVRRFWATGRPVAAICHGPQLLIEADVVRGKTLTAYASVRTDLRNAGATVVDEAVVEDGALITSRKPADLEAFCEALLKRL